MTDGHVCFADVMDMVEINLLATILQSKAVKPLNTVGGYPSIWDNILLGSLGHFLKEMQKGISLFLALQRPGGTVRTPIR